jgi:hypothetical protein
VREARGFPDEVFDGLRGSGFGEGDEVEMHNPTGPTSLGSWANRIGHSGSFGGPGG